VDRLSTAAFPGVDRPGRKFYFGDAHFVKRLDFDPGEQHRSELRFQPALRDQIVREIGIHVMLRDCGIPNIARMVDWEVTSQHGSIVFDRVRGDLLSSRHTEMTVADLRRVILDVIDTIQHLQATGTFHNDIRIFNVMVDDSGRGVLIDFGLAGPVEIESNKAGLLHLIADVATRQSERGEYPLSAPTIEREMLGPFVDLFDFVASDRFQAVGVRGAFPA
jgi:serine/threonine protein kinase